MDMQQWMGRAMGRPPEVPNGAQWPPRVSGWLPVVGHLHDFLRNPLTLLARAHAEHGEVAWLEVGPKRLFAVFGPDAHEAVFRAPDTVLNPQEAYALMTPIFGQGIMYDATVEKMGEQVRMLLPALKDRPMRTYAQAITREVEESLASWGDEGVVDLVDYCRVLTNFTSSRCLLGVEFREQMSDEFASIYHDLELGITPLAYLNPYLPLPSFRRRDRARVRLVELVDKIIARRRSEKREEADFLQTLMASTYADGRPLNGEEITGMLLAAMFAGHHTSSVTTSWAMLDLLRDRRAMQRVIDEVDRTVDPNSSMTMKTVRRLEFTDQVVKETLRLHPPLFLLVRVAQTDWQFKDYFVPKGSWITISPTVSHLSPRYFKDPERFDPDRFGSERAGEVTPWSYIPFGGGRHKCLGNAFAMLQIKTILAILLQRYDFDLVGDAIEDSYQSLVIGPKEPCRLRYRRRTTRTHVSVPSAAETKPVVNAEAAAAGCPAHTTDAAEATSEPADTTTLSVILDLDLCQGHAVCTGEAPEIFDLNDDGKVMLLVDAIDPKHYQAVRDAARYCPTGTIKLIED